MASLHWSKDCVRSNKMADPNFRINPLNYIGIDTLQEQVRVKSVKRGFTFNLVVAGMYKEPE